MKMSEFVEDIRRAIREGTLKQPFRGADVRRACPRWSGHTYFNFLPKHRVGKPGKGREYFIQHHDGSYSLKD